MRRHRGLSLLDSLIGILLVGLAAVALIQLSADVTVSNQFTRRLDTAMAMAGNVHEFAVNLACADPGAGPRPSVTSDAAFDNMCFLDGLANIKPIDAKGNTLKDSSGKELYPDWTLSCQVKAYDPKTYDSADPEKAVVPGFPDNAFRRLDVTVYYQGKVEYTTKWILAPTQTS